MAARGAGNIAFHRQFETYNDELQAAGKKSDDGKARPDPFGTTWTGTRVKLRSRRRRLFVGVGIVLLVWLLIRSIPDDFWEPNETGARRIAEFHSGTNQADFGNARGYMGGGYGSRLGGGSGRKDKDADETRPPPRPNNKKPKEDLQYYDGEILFRRLPATLHTIQRTMGFRKANQNVLFAASSLKSLATILPLACAMAQRDLTYVHVSVLGRSSIGIEELLHINGVDQTTCKAYWHDARPNWAPYSSDLRTESSIASALEHIQDFMHPQVVIMDDSSLEDQYFTRQLRIKAAKHEWPIIELPAGSSEKLHWLSRLDAPALRAFHKTTIAILVQAPRAKAGGLLRLLRSLQQADYAGLPPPKLTIELPSDIEPAVSHHISGYRWPPPSAYQPSPSSQLNVRKRILGQVLSPEEASVRFLESFYPHSEEHSHALVLNDNIELSPLFYHWIMYYVLHYKHSRNGSPFSSELAGISIELPDTYLNGTTNFEPPTAASLDSLLWPGRSDPQDPETSPPFMWQVPNPNAALIFGDKWVEIQSFLTQRLLATKHVKKQPREVVGKHLPAWTEYVLELMRARGWSFLYPPTSEDSQAMAVVLQDLRSIPEEFTVAYHTSQQQKSEDDQKDAEPLTGDTNTPLRGAEAHWKNPEPSLTQTRRSLHDVLPFRGEEPRLQSLPHLLFDGTIIQSPEVGAAAVDYAENFRREIGGCKPDDKSKALHGKADDLFCWTEQSPG